MGDTSSVGYWAVRSVVREGHKELGAATMANNEDSDVKMIEDKTDVSLKQARKSSLMHFSHGPNVWVQKSC